MAQRLGNTALKKRRSGSDTVSNLKGLGIEPQTFRADSDVLTTELTDRLLQN